MLENDMAWAMERLTDSESSPEERLRATKTLRVLRKSNHRQLIETLKASGIGERDLVLPVLELAQNKSLDTEIRTEAVRGVVGTKLAEVRAPLMDLLGYDDAAGGAFDGDACTPLPSWRC